MGDVYLAHHLLLGSRVALKVLAGERAGDPVAARRFVREARSAFRVDHPNCIRVTDLGAAEGRLYIAMEYLDGRTVAEELAVDGPIASGRAAHIAAQIAEALAHAHGLGLVHRDLKPENVMLVTREADPDFVKVLDFGLARIFDEHGDLAGTAISLAPLTRDGLVFGTPEYMSPEQASGGRVGPESDIYSLGAVLYHMVTGAVPFGGATFTEILSRHVREAPVPPSLRRPDRGIPAAIDDIVLECLSKVAASRPTSARALADRLRALAGEIGRAGSRLAPHLAASETMDLEASQVARAAAASAAVPA
ncbi:MAG TPA: serine/threonine-protein kinase, partial [Kofleriaceae bacterium]|nr:serine/threonine-protein kinase [Kofleriaceae bacterium]